MPLLHACHAPACTAHSSNDTARGLMMCHHRWGMSLDRSEITTLVLKVLGKARSKGKHPAAAKWGKDGVVSRKWLQGFLRRHPSIAPVLITSE